MLFSYYIHVLMAPYFLPAACCLYLQADASAAIIQGAWRSVHMRRNRAAAAIQSAWKMRIQQKAFHRDMCAVIWMQQRLRRSVAKPCLLSPDCFLYIFDYFRDCLSVCQQCGSPRESPCS